MAKAIEEKRLNMTIPLTDPFSIDQTKPAHGTNGFQSLGQFRFAAHEKATVLYRMAGARGTVHIDAVQVIPMK
jgi:hypothetical protein